MQSLKKFILLFALLAIPAMSLNACHTVEGVGKDVEQLGESVEGAGESGYND